MLLRHKLFLQSQNIILDYICKILNQANPRKLNQSIYDGLGRFNSSPEIISSHKKLLDKILDKPVVIVCNHSNIIEPVILLASLPNFKNQHLIMRSVFTKRLPHLRSNLLPVYITHHFFPDKTLEKQERIKNQKTISKASRLLESNHQIIIFPGAATQDKTWKTGIGHMLVNTNNLNQIYLLPCFITQTSIYDIFRLFPIIRNFFPKLIVDIQKPILIKKISQSTDPKTLTQDLFNYYKTIPSTQTTVNS